MDVKTAHMDLKKPEYLIKTSNDLSFHFNRGEVLSIVERDFPEDVNVEDLENKKLPIYMIDPGSELLYSIVHIRKIT